MEDYKAKNEPKFNCAYTELVDVFKLIPNPKNPNTHPPKQINMLAKIIDFQGQRKAIVVSKLSGFMTKGHGTLTALKMLGYTQVAVDFQDYDSPQMEYSDMKADNEIQALSKLDKKADRKHIKELEFDDDFDIELFGIEDVIKEVEKIQEDVGNSVGHSNGKVLQTCPQCKHKFTTGAKS